MFHKQYFLVVDYIIKMHIGGGGPLYVCRLLPSINQNGKLPSTTCGALNTSNESLPGT